MDPDEALRRARQAIEDIRDGHSLALCADELATAFADLDQWLRGGGFLPYDWRQALAP